MEDYSVFAKICIICHKKNDWTVYTHILGSQCKHLRETDLHFKWILGTDSHFAIYQWMMN